MSRKDKTTKIQEKRIVEVVERNTDTGFIKVKKWIPQTKIQEIIEERYAIPQSTTRKLLQDLTLKKILQTTIYKGRRFYAPATLPHSFIIKGLPFIVASIVMAVMIDLYPTLTGYPRNLGTYIVSASPFIFIALWHVVSKKLNVDVEYGICLRCGNIIPDGEM